MTEENILNRLPRDFLEEMKELLNDDYDKFLESYSFDSQRAFRINTVKPTTFDLTRFGNKRVPYTENSFYLEDDSLGNSVFHRLGAVYIQEPSAMIPALVLNPPKGSRVLDMCASPGGKSGQLAELIGEEGVLVSNEINLSRSRVLLGNVERLGLRNTVVTNMSPKEIAKNLRGWFDAVLVDAPCSGEGMFRKNADAISEWTIERSKSCGDRQKEIIEESAKCVKEGGYLVYSTCTFSKRENEDVVEYLLKKGDFELCPIPEKYPCEKGKDEFGYTGRIYPHKMQGEGHFTALLRRITPSEQTNKKRALRELTKKEENHIKPFIDKINNHPRAQVFNNNIVFPPKIVPPLPYGIIGLGVKAGEINERFIPHHQVFSAYGKDFQNKIELSADDSRVVQYLRGEEIEIKEEKLNGWTAVLVDGCPLGGAKVSDCRAKNHYPKGLRTK